MEITTWNKDFRTAAGVGPCSSIADLKSAYGNALSRRRTNTIDGKVYAYMVGHLIFGANGSAAESVDARDRCRHLPGHHPGFAAYVLLNEPECT